ncbi:MAG: TRAP transporter fused permease subunit [Pseudomonadota bacterium]
MSDLAPASSDPLGTSKDSETDSGFFSIALGILSALLTLAAIGFAADVPSRLGLSFYTEQFLALVLGISLAIVFLDRRSRDRTSPRPASLIDVALAATGLGLGVYIAFDYARLLSAAYSAPLDAVLIAGALFILVVEAMRRKVGMTLVVVVLCICVYGLVGHAIEGPLQTRQVDWDQMLVYLGFDANGVLGLTMMVAATVVVAFVFFGQLLLKSGGADFFNDIALATMGRKRGGAAKISILASGLFGSISGVVVSNIVATGVVTIRLMVTSGLSRHKAAAVEAVSSTGGQIVPPVMGAVAFLMADILQRPYAEIVTAAIVPALLYYIAVYAQVDLEAARDEVSAIDESLIPRARSVLAQGWIFALPFAAIIYAIFYANQRPETAALWGSLAAIVVGIYGYGQRKIRARHLLEAAMDTGRAVVDIVLIAAAAGFIIGVLNVTGLGFGLTFSLVSLGSGSLLALLLIAAGVCIVLGMGMPTVGVYLLLAVLVAPSLIESGVDPIAAHLFIFYLGMMSMVTPPVAIGAFFAAAIAEAKPMQTAFASMKLGWTAYVVPFLFVASPAMLLNGDWGEVVWTVATACLGVYLLSAALVGHLAGRLSAPQRALVATAGAVLLMPPSIIASLIPINPSWLSFAGLGLVCIAIAIQKLGPAKAI